jgi:hypothetical protein
MNPKKIRESMEELYPPKSKVDEKIEKKISWAYELGFLLGNFVSILIGWLLFLTFYEVFGLPHLNFIQFFGIWWVLSLVARIFRK